MKKIFYIIAFSLILFYTQSVSAIVCDQTFEWTILRYDKWYKFYDTWHNNTSKDTFINTRSIRFLDSWNSNELMTSSYLDPGSAFDWTQELKNNKFKVGAGTSMRIIETWPTNWRISKTPINRTNATKNSHDFMIYYKVAYDQSNNYPNSSDDVSHVECKYYSVSWCWDWVKDAWYEVCDPKDPNKSWWGNWGCNVNTCDPINVNPPATCDSISVTPNTWIASLWVDISCSWTNALTYTIQCWNWATINSKTWKCTYATVWDYHPSCTVNSTITSDSCKSKVVVKAPTPAIQVEKYSWNPNDLDWNKNHNQADDTQTVNISDKAVFTIEVNNVWNEDLSNVYLTDPTSPSCNRSETEVKSILKTIWNLDEIFNIWETFKYTCEKLDTKSDYINRINVNAIWVNSKIPVSDTDDTEVKIVKPSILLVKTDINPNDLDWIIWNDTQTVNVWSWAIFKITVTNNGTEDLNNIVISDILAPNCSGNLTLPSTKPATWLNFTVYWSWNNSDNIFQVWESFSYNCEKTNTQSNYTNTASVTWKWITSLKDVSDDDTSDVIIKNLTTPTCNSLTATPLTWVNSLNSTLTCAWSNATTYTINCWNGQVINASTGTCNYNTIWTYTPTCFVNGNVTSSSCQQTVSVTNSTSSSSSSWGWDSYQCRDISMSWNQVKCTWNHLVKTFRLSCNWAYLFANANSSTGNTTTATFTCNDNNASCSVYNQVVNESSFYSWLSNPACNLIPSSSSSSWGSSSSSSWGSSSSSSGWSSPDYCWDWVVQRPNDNFQNEECDFWSSARPAWCTSSCKINWISSIPNDWEIVFWPSDNLIIWDNMNPYSVYSLDKPSIFNKSSYDLYFDSLCVAKKTWSTLNWTTTCQSIWKILFPWASFSFNTYPNFVWSTSSLTSWTFWDNTLVTTIEHEWVLYKDAYFASELKVRVSKPSIATTWGWTSFVKTTSNIANVSDVTGVIWTSNKNKNFVGAWVSNWNISSYSSNVNDSTSVNSISNEWVDYNNSVNNSIPNTALTSIWTSSNLSDFKNYNWISNAYVIKNTSFIVSSSTFTWLTWPRTYIIENWNLIINSNINYSDNIAFVVKWGNIQIDKSVTSISWTYISIPVWSSWWDIKWINWTTNDVLTVKWSLYWNLENLLNKRTYIKENSWVLSVWTIVSFGSSVFRDPAPLTSTFINEYLDATKVSK